MAGTHLYGASLPFLPALTPPLITMKLTNSFLKSVDFQAAT